jgi:hypothetical protein
MAQSGSRAPKEQPHRILFSAAALLGLSAIMRLALGLLSELLPRRSGGDAANAMKEEDFQREFAAKRSHQDAQAANEHTKLVDQWALGLNGAAATAILTFSSANSSILARGPIAIAIALGFFACGAALGALAMRAHSMALYEWLYVWSVRAGVRDPSDAPASDTAEKNYKDAIRRARRHDWYFRFCISCFLAGCATFGMNVVYPFQQLPHAPIAATQKSP